MLPSLIATRRRQSASKMFQTLARIVSPPMANITYTARQLGHRRRRTKRWLVGNVVERHGTQGSFTEGASRRTGRASPQPRLRGG